MSLISRSISVGARGCNFKTLKEVCDSITDSGPTKPCEIIGYTEVFTEDPFTIPAHTVLNLRNFILTPNNNSADFITMSDASVIRFAKRIDAPTTSGAAVLLNGFITGNVAIINLKARYAKWCDGGYI
jgi:hypothetical protein